MKIIQAANTIAASICSKDIDIGHCNYDLSAIHILFFFLSNTYIMLNVSSTIKVITTLHWLDTFGSQESESCSITDKITFYCDFVTGSLTDNPGIIPCSFPPLGIVR